MDAARFDVVGLGENATDVAIELPHFPAFNTKLELTRASWQAGGQVATALTVCQRLGLRTKYIGRVGDDPFGVFQLETLRREGMDLSDTRVVEGCANQVAYILIDGRTGERTILWKRDSRLDIRPDELRPEMITCGRLLHVDGHDTAAAAQAAQWARHAGIPVTLDVDNIYAGLEALLDQTEYIVGSTDFPRRYTGKEDLFAALLEVRRRHRQARLVAATLGRDGVLALEGDRFLYSPAYEVCARDTTGAGDVFHGAFVFALLQGWPMERVLDFSNAMAGLNCEAVGARGGIATRAQAEQLMAGGRRRRPRWTSLPLPAEVAP
ncbi:MAG TPA: carbohydrate kinase family protein [Candidatus Xenobia bacterium]|nr:carbohydrate kinase family protein [Candidatus Xenobia bacterium]